MAKAGAELAETRLDALRLVLTNPGVTTKEAAEELGLKTSVSAMIHLNNWMKQGRVYWKKYGKAPAHHWYPVLHQSTIFFLLSKKWDSSLQGYLKNATCCHLEPERQSSSVSPRYDAKKSYDLARYYENFKQEARGYGQSERCPMGGIGARFQNQCPSIFPRFDEATTSTGN